MNRNSHNVEQFIENKENEELHSTHYMELELYEHIRNGNPKKLADFLKSTPLNLNEKKLAKSPLRQKYFYQYGDKCRDDRRNSGRR